MWLVAGMLALASCTSIAPTDGAVPPAGETSTTLSSDAPAPAGSAAAVDPYQRGPVRLETWMSAESGRVVDGEFVSDEPEGAFRWSTQVDVDEVNGYLYFRVEGQAEVGDSGCAEFLVADGVSSSRLNFEPHDDPAMSELFVPIDTPDDDELIAHRVPATVDELFDQLGIPLPEPTATGTITADLDSIQVQTLADVLLVTRWAFNVPVEGTVEVMVLANRRMTSMVVEAEGSSGDRFESIRLEASLEPLTGPLTNAASPRPEVGFCRTRSLDAIGTWELSAIISGESATPVELLPAPYSAATLTVDPVGNLLGSTGCRSFSGTTSFGFDRLLSVTLAGEESSEIDESSCSSADEELSVALVETLESGPRIGIFPDETIWLSDPESDLVFVFRLASE